MTKSSIKNNTQQFDNIKIQENKEFVNKTINALKLLKKTNGYSVICPYLGMIKESKHSGMKVYGKIPTFEVGERTWRQPDIWYASCIAHDGYHSLLYHQAKEKNGKKEPSLSTWTGKQAERSCLRFQLQILRNLNADQPTLDYIKKLVKNPTYQDIAYKNGDW